MESKVMTVIPETLHQEKTTTSTMKHRPKDLRVCLASGLGSKIVSERMKARSSCLSRNLNAVQTGQRNKWLCSQRARALQRARFTNGLGTRKRNCSQLPMGLASTWLQRSSLGYREVAKNHLFMIEKTSLRWCWGKPRWLGTNSEVIVANAGVNCLGVLRKNLLDNVRQALITAKRQRRKIFASC